MRVSLCLTMISSLILMSRALRPSFKIRNMFGMGMVKTTGSKYTICRQMTTKEAVDDLSGQKKRLLTSIRNRLATKSKQLTEIPSLVTETEVTVEQPTNMDMTTPTITSSIPKSKLEAGVEAMVNSAKERRKAMTARTVSMAAAKGDVIVEEGAVVIYDQEEPVAAPAFTRLGLISEIAKGVASQGFTEPTPVQRAVIPRLLAKENLVMAASTGSGKTLAFTLPVIQELINQESLGYKRQMQRPRCLILVPTRELAKQILSSVKQISHFAKMSSAAVLGGEPYGQQKTALSRNVDIVVASPGRLMQHKEKGNVFLSHVTHVIIDEVDTMLTQGFGSDIRAILRAALNKYPDANNTLTSQPAQVIMATATLTRAVKELLNDVNGNFNVDFSDVSNKTPRKLNGNETSVNINIVEVDGVHRTLPHVQHLVEDTKGDDKLEVLKRVLERFKARQLSTLVFCNTVASCRAVEYALNETEIGVLSYHGDLNSKDRAENLERFRAGEFKCLVCSDIAARGLDIPDVGHVVMFDFPLNSVDYIHRAGRCGRAGRKGIVTALVTKRDKVLSDAIQGAIARGLPIDNLTSAKRDYQDKGKLASVVGRAKGPSKKTKALRERVSVVRRGAGRGGERVSKYASKAEEKSKDDAAKNKGASALAASTFNKQSSPLLGTKSRGGGGSKLSQSFPKKRLR